jgi:cell division protein FtsB
VSRRAADLRRELAVAVGRRRRSLVVVAVVAASMTLAATFGERGYLERLRYEREEARLVAEIAELEQANAVLSAEVDALRTDPLALERIAREELSLGRPGEVLVLLDRPVERDPRISGSGRRP